MQSISWGACFTYSSWVSCVQYNPIFTLAWPAPLSWCYQLPPSANHTRLWFPDFWNADDYPPVISVGFISLVILPTCWKVLTVVQQSRYFREGHSYNASFRIYVKNCSFLVILKKINEVILTVNSISWMTEIVFELAPVIQVWILVLWINRSLFQLTSVLNSGDKQLSYGNLANLRTLR